MPKPLEYFMPYESPFGVSYGQWTVRWWQWAHSSPTNLNPVLDSTGANAAVNQTGPVWFIAGTFGEKQTAKRSCSIPSGKAILFPVINYEMNELENLSIKAGPDLIKHVKEDIDDIVTKEAKVDNELIPIYRVQSDPEIFNLYINDNNSMGIVGGTTEAAADGYWVFLKPLALGHHRIFFRGSCAAGKRRTAAEYILTIYA